MSREKRLNRTQEVVGSSPISSTIRFNNLRDVCARKQKCECLVPRLVQPIRVTIFQQLTRKFFASNSGGRRFDFARAF